jgi:hypothetical protein
MNPEVYHGAKVAAVTRKLTIGGWLEEAVNEKLRREERGREFSNEKTP